MASSSERIFPASSSSSTATATKGFVQEAISNPERKKPLWVWVLGVGVCKCKVAVCRGQRAPWGNQTTVLPNVLSGWGK